MRMKMRPDLKYLTEDEKTEGLCPVCGGVGYGCASCDGTGYIKWAIALNNAFARCSELEDENKRLRDKETTP